MRKNKMDINPKSNTLNYNLDILINNIHKNNDEISFGYAQYLISCLELLKDKSKKSSGLHKQKGIKIKDVFNNKEYISLREAERKTGINIAEIKYSIEHNIGLQKSYKFEILENKK